MSDDDHVQVGLDRAVVEDDAQASASDDSDDSDDSDGATEPTNVTVQDCTEEVGVIQTDDDGGNPDA